MDDLTIGHFGSHGDSTPIFNLKEDSEDELASIKEDLKEIKESLKRIECYTRQLL